MKYSFIIPTYNRIDELKELIPSLEELCYDHSEYELIIVDDGSTDDTIEYVQNLNSIISIRYYKQANLGPGPARNRGMTESTGDYMLFVDSDCILPPEYLTELEKEIQVEHYDAFGGPDTYHPSFSPLLKAINYAMTSFIGTGGTRGSKKSVTKYFPRSFNMGIHKIVYDKIGGFGDLRHGQDMDYSARIYAAGFKVGFIDKAYVYHKRRTSLWKFIKQIHNWGVTRINLASMHNDMLKPIHLAPAILVLSSFIITLLSFFLTLAKMAFICGLAIIFLVALFAFCQSFLAYKSFKVALLSILTLFIQVGAYGIGTLNGIWQKWILKKPVAHGFTKNYYGKK